MYTKFLRKYSLERPSSELYEGLDRKAKKTIHGFSALSNLFDNLGGCTFDQGLYRIHTYGSSLYWSELVANYFGDYKHKIYCFGFDWFGRHFAIDLQKYSTGEDVIYLFDPATGEDLSLNQNLELFHEENLVNQKNDLFAYKRYTQWRKKNKSVLELSQCVGFKVPLFLGGQDEISNFEVVDMGVYWEFSYQLFNKTRNLPEGTLIDRISLDEDF